MESGIFGGVEETRMEEILDDFRRALEAQGSRSLTVTANHAQYVKTTYLDELDGLALRHFRATHIPILSVRGRSLALLYKVISTLVSPPRSMSVFILDLEARFDATRLNCAETDLHHVYVQRPNNDSSRSSSRGAGIGAHADHSPLMVAEAENWMLYSDVTRASIHRQWWGSIVVGGSGAGDLISSWKGWLRVDREHVSEFAPGTSVEEAHRRRSTHQETVDASCWAATSPWGGFIFDDE